MRIFITGVTGFIGGRLKQWFEQQGHTVHGHLRGGDLAIELQDVTPDLIINCAAEIYDKQAMWSVNVGMVKTLLDYVQQRPATAMIQLGSSSEYGACNQPTRESDAIRATDMYATTKGMATHLCQGSAVTWNLDVVVVRPYSPYGPGERAHRLFPRLWRAFKLGEPMTLVQGVHDFCYIDDFVEAIDIIARSDQRTPGEIINVSSGLQTTNRAVLELFRNITGQPGAVEERADWVTPPMWCADISHVREKYGWAPRTTVAQGIERFLKEANYE